MQQEDAKWCRMMPACCKFEAKGPFGSQTRSLGTYRPEVAEVIPYSKHRIGLRTRRQCQAGRSEAVQSLFHFASIWPKHSLHFSFSCYFGFHCKRMSWFYDMFLRSKTRFLFGIHLWKAKRKWMVKWCKVPPSLAQSPAFSGSFGTRLILVFRWDLDKPLAAVDIPEMQSKCILYCHSCKGPKNSISLLKSTIHALPFSIWTIKKHSVDGWAKQRHHQKAIVAMWLEHLHTHTSCRPPYKDMLEHNTG